jgi:Dyp-type peroxidase family
MENLIEKTDIQGLLVRAYKELGFAYYVMIHFNDPKKAKEWLADIIPKLTTADVKPADFAIQLAFTNSGVAKFIDTQKLQTPFSREFNEGMAVESRQRVLGDYDLSDPKRWVWGNEKKESIDAILMIYTNEEKVLNEKYEEQKQEFLKMGITEIKKLDTNSAISPKEHFGFTDGISQPRIKGFSEKDAPLQSEFDIFNSTMPGEFILGYKNEYNINPFSPVYKNETEEIDLGKNGSYMVFRHLEQNVKEFWNFVHNTAETNPHFKDDDEIEIASKMFGRYPNGNPLNSKTGRDERMIDRNNFFYSKNDSDGFSCPVGAHIRKSNPRDGIDEDVDASKQIAKRHRILRRGRSFGEPLDASMEPQKMRQSTVVGERGLYFICFNTNIARQFEFIQQAWLNSPKFEGLENDVDPITGFAFDENHKYIPGNFTIQGCPVRKKLNNIPQFVYVKGGAYFFMPGIKALNFMATA